MILKPTNAHKCMKVCYTHRIPPTYFGSSGGHPQGGALQIMDTTKNYRSIRTNAQI
jgi:hypothetical protein